MARSDFGPDSGLHFEWLDTQLVSHCRAARISERGSRGSNTSYLGSSIFESLIYPDWSSLYFASELWGVGRNRVLNYNPVSSAQLYSYLLFTNHIIRSHINLGIENVTKYRGIKEQTAPYILECFWFITGSSFIEVFPFGGKQSLDW